MSNYNDLIHQLFPGVKYKEFVFLIANVPDTVRDIVIDAYEYTDKEIPFDDFVGYTLMIGIETLVKIQSGVKDAN